MDRSRKYKMSYEEFLAVINQNATNAFDYKWLCRFCLQKKPIGIDISDDNASTLLENYHVITKEYLPTTPEYPNFVCMSCECNLNDYASFIQQVTKNAEHWKMYLESNNDVKITIKEIDSSYHVSSLQSSSMAISKVEEIKVEYCEDEVLDTSNVRDVFDSSLLSDRELGNLVQIENMSPKLYYERSMNIVSNNAKSPKKTRKYKKMMKFISQTSTDFERTCKLCNEPTFVSMRRFYIHLRQQHPGEKVFTCDICSSQFNNKKRLVDHIEDRHATCGRRYQCQFCAKLFFSDRECKGHEKVHLNARQYVCQLCGKGFNQKTLLNTHMKSKAHNTEYKTILKKNSWKVCSAKESLRCELCNPPIMFSCREERAMHRNLQHRTFQCDVCQNSFMAQESLDSHKLRHSDKPRPFVCTICNASYNQSSHLAGHIKRKHTENKSFHCEHCDKSFFENCELTVHMKLLHKKQERVKCKQCSCDFANEKYLKKHVLQKHSTEILRYDCKICGKRNSNGATLDLHRARHH